ncbi:GNAT family N-acetyltransferase [Mucilaginibacter sp. UYCu711]|uniref:GNAT family N-acetyltransferase n=1 Tax=Mucilaginibacter sp. UYCu711 TaxID=3156339 RepID=UPI003D229688
MINPGSTYITERLGLNNIADMDLLYKAVYGYERPVGFFQKKYDTDYTGVKYIGYLAYNQQHQPIAFYGVIPTLVWYNGKTVLAAQSADTMTHPGYRNMGVFRALANLTYALCKQEGISLVFGFPNQNSLPGFIKMGWHITESLDSFQIRVGGMLQLQMIARRYPVLRPLYNWYTDRILKNYLKNKKGVQNSVLADGYNGVFRDDNYLNYKTYSPTRVIEIDGVLFWIKLQNGLQVGDIANIAGNFDSALQKLKALARKLGITQIYFQLSPQTHLHTVLSRDYKPVPAFQAGFKNIEGDLVHENIKFTLADIDIF